MRQSPATNPKGKPKNQNKLSSETSFGVRCSSSRIHSNPWDHSHVCPASNYPAESPEELDACHVDPRVLKSVRQEESFRFTNMSRSGDDGSSFIPSRFASLEGSSAAEASAASMKQLLFSSFPPACASARRARRVWDAGRCWQDAAGGESVFLIFFLVQLQFRRKIQHKVSFDLYLRI